MENIFDEIWQRLKQQAPHAVFIKQGEKEVMIDKDRKCFVVKCKAKDLKEGRK